MFYVYVFYRAESRRFYIGYTKDLKRRFLEHKNKKVRSTSYSDDLKLVFYEAYIAKEDARRRERYFKTTKGKRVLRNMLTDTLKIME